MSLTQPMSINMTPYPESTELKNNLSIFHLALRHQVEHKTFKDFYQRLEKTGWQLHEYLQTAPSANRSLKRAFLPQAIFTPYAQESIFGKTWMDEVKGKSQAEQHKTAIKERLNPNNNLCPHSENLLLTQKDNQILRSPLHLNIKEQERTFVFTIEWIDLWLFNDTTGILAFKTQLQQVGNQTETTPSVDDLNVFNRLLRYPGGILGSSENDTIYHANNPKQKFSLWNEIIYNQCLGLNKQNVLMLEENKDKEKILDPYSRYSKLFTVAQIPNIQDKEKEFIWNRPFTNPDLTKNVDYKQWEKNQASPAFDAYQRFMLAYYPTLQDLLLLELATTSGEGKSWNDKGWQYDAHYMKQLFADNDIKIWAYWSGLALKDVCAFMVYDDNMPLMAKKQAESHYYPLYIHTYHQHFCLEVLSEEIIDHSLYDCVKARQILEKFHAFHNQYWFKETTIDFQGVEVASRMKQGLGVEKKYQTVKEEIKEISSFIDNKVQAGKQTLIALLILLFYPFQYLGIGERLKPFVAEGDMTWFIGINLVFLGIVVMFWFFLLPRLLGPFCKLLAKLYKKPLE